MQCYDLIHGALDCILKGPGLNLVRLMCFVLEQNTLFSLYLFLAGSINGY